MHAARVRGSVTAVALLSMASSVGSAFVASDARAGGFDLPDNGAQSLGRGAAFVAKADDGTAIYYNPAGLARQRGTQLYAGGNLYLHSFELQRSGSFPDDPNNPATPWGGTPYPRVTNTAAPFFAPFVSASTDFATFDRLTFALGVFSPPMVGNRTFPLTVGNAPAPSRYDAIQSRSTLFFPTASFGYRVTPWLDLGVSAHLVLARFDQTMVTYADVGQCANAEYQPCDSRATLDASGTSLAGTFGALARPTPNVAFGLSVRTPVSLEAQGSFTPQAPRSLSRPLAPGDASLSTRLPLIVRGGLRYIEMLRDFELYDLELDATYEGWGAAQGAGPRLRIPSLGSLTNIDATLVHAYSDTFSIRGGGAYNFEVLDGLVAVRGGAFFDSPATDLAHTRLDVDTLAKVAGTLGLGYRRGAFAVDVAYAAVASMPRLVRVTRGDVRPINIGRGGKPVDDNGAFYPAVNSGAYQGFTHILALGIAVTFDELFGGGRTFHYGNTYERGYVPTEPAHGVRREERREERPPEPPPEPPEQQPDQRREERGESGEGCSDPCEEPKKPAPGPPPQP